MKCLFSSISQKCNGYKLSEIFLLKVWEIDWIILWNPIFNLFLLLPNINYLQKYNICFHSFCLLQSKYTEMIFFQMACISMKHILKNFLLLINAVYWVSRDILLPSQSNHLFRPVDCFLFTSLPGQWYTKLGELSLVLWLQQVELRIIFLCLGNGKCDE